MEKLNIWVVKVGEPAVFHDSQAGKKPLRAALISQELSKLGHEVTWWTGNFQHHDKSFLFSNKGFNQETYKGVKIEYIPSIGYRKHLSFRRFLDHRILAKNTSVEIKKKNPPDLIFCSWPLVELTEVFYDFAKENSVPIVIDVRDQWPDVIYRRVSDFLGQKLELHFLPSYERVLKKCLVGADAVISISEPFLNWVYHRSGRIPKRGDMVCRLSSKDLKAVNYNKKEVSRFWQNLGVTESESVLRVVMVGTLLKQDSMMNFLHAISSKDLCNVQFVVCGSGQLEQKISESDLQNLVFAGYVDEGQISHLFKISDVGLLPYDNTEDFLMSIPNKVGEYLSCGLHVLTSLRGEVFDFFKGSDSATFYNPHISEDIVLNLIGLYGSRDNIRKNKSNSRSLYLDNLKAEINYYQLALHLEDVAIKR